jgi:Flp pilus assembly protein TadD
MEHALLAGLLSAHGKIPEAIAAYRTVVEIEPLNPNGWSAVSALLIENGNLTEARKAAARAIEMYPDPRLNPARFILGMAAMVEGDPKGALAEFERGSVEA